MLKYDLKISFKSKRLLQMSKTSLAYLSETVVFLITF